MRFVFILLALLHVAFIVDAQNKDVPMKGITFVAPPSEVGDKEMEDLKKVNTEWIALVPYGFSRKDQPGIRYNLKRQWWGEKKEGIVECIRLAHKNGIKVMLKPQVYIHNSWVGSVDFDTEEEWKEWEKAYSEYINFYGQIAAENNAPCLITSAFWSCRCSLRSVIHYFNALVQFDCFADAINYVFSRKMSR